MRDLAAASADGSSALLLGAPFVPGHVSFASEVAQAFVREQVEALLNQHSADGDAAWSRARAQLLPTADNDQVLPLSVRELFSEDFELDLQKAFVYGALEDQEENTDLYTKNAREAARRIWKLHSDEGLVSGGGASRATPTLPRRRRRMGLFQSIDDLPVLLCIVFVEHDRRRGGFMCVRLGRGGVLLPASCSLPLLPVVAPQRAVQG